MNVKQKRVVLLILLGICLVVVMDFIQPTTPTDSSGNELINKNNQQGNIVGDGTVQRVLTGFQKDGFGDGKDYGIKVSQEGYDVRTATDDQLVMSSGFNMFKIVQTGETSLSPPSPWPPGDYQRATIAHNLGYKPAFLVYVDNPGISGAGYYAPGLSLVPSTIHLTASYEVLFQSFAFVDSTNLYIDLQYFNSAGGDATGFNTFTWSYKYYILQETAT